MVDWLLAGTLGAALGSAWVRVTAALCPTRRRCLATLGVPALGAYVLTAYEWIPIRLDASAPSAVAASALAGAAAGGLIASYAAPPPFGARGRGAVPEILAVALAASAVLAFLAYERFLLSYLLSDGCIGCTPDGGLLGVHVRAPRAELLAGSAMGALLVGLALLRVGYARAVRVGLWLGSVAVALAACACVWYGARAALAPAGRWAALTTPPELVRALAVAVALLMLPLLVRARLVRDVDRFAPQVLAIAAALLVVSHSSSNVRLIATALPHAAAGELLEHAARFQRVLSGALVLLWLAALGLGSLTFSGARERRRWALTSASGALALVALPRLLDAANPLPPRLERAGQLSLIATCAARAGASGERASSGAAPLELPVALGQPLDPLRGLLDGAQRAGVERVVVPALHATARDTWTLGPVRVLERCPAGAFTLGSGARSRPLGEFRSLAELFAAKTPVDATR